MKVNKRKWSTRPVQLDVVSFSEAYNEGMEIPSGVWGPEGKDDPARFIATAISFSLTNENFEPWCAEGWGDTPADAVRMVRGIFNKDRACPSGEYVHNRGDA